MALVGRGADQYMMRMPDGMRDEIAAAAKANGRSMNSEIVARLSVGGGNDLRDQFAIAALTGYFAAPHTGHRNADEAEVAEYLYRMADRMLAARKGGAS